MRILLLFTLLFATTIINAQTERALAREGNSEFNNEQYGDAEIAYRNSLKANEKSDLPETVFNLGNALFQQERWEEASTYFKRATEMLKDKNQLAEAYHNLGNSLLQESKLDESIEAYKQALRNNPKDVETKYNLSYAQQLKKQQEQQEQEKQCNNPKQDKNQEEQQQKEQEQKEQENKEQEKSEEQEQQEQQQSEEQKSEEEKEQQQQQGEKGEEQNQEQQQAEQKEGEQGDSTMMTPQEMQLSREEMERLLEALKNEELKVQEKLRQQNGKQLRTDKDW